MSEEGKAIVKQAVTEDEIATSIAAKATAPQVQKAAAFLKALAHPARLRILCRLSEGPASVGALELYLHLHAVLTAQTPLSEAHDEMLFIIQHQTSELWMRLALHELTFARDAIARDDFPNAFKTSARLARIFDQLNGAWDVLRTMTPSDYTRFRDRLGQRSGFQSWQYRLIEFTVGNCNRAMLGPHGHRPDLLARLEAELQRPSLYDAALAALARAGFALPERVLSRDWAEPRAVEAEVTAA